MDGHALGRVPGGQASGSRGGDNARVSGPGRTAGRMQFWFVSKKFRVCMLHDGL